MQFIYRLGRDNLCHVHVSLVPIVGGEQKSKPIQHSMQTLRAVGMPPDLIVCRCKEELERSIVQKISGFGMLPPSHIISNTDVPNIYAVALLSVTFFFRQRIRVTRNL